MNELDALISVAHLLLEELEVVTDALDQSDTLSRREFQEEIQDANAAIERGKEILSRYPI